ncbi:MAG: DUF2029 domain-containing protein [Alphaproteobacteria bacterium]|nr:DUF2029 domain-containing protein [Alphaproteobacteria bacterium]
MTAATTATARRADRHLVLLGVLLVALTAFGPTLHLRFGDGAHGALMLLSGLGAAWAYWRSDRFSARFGLLVVLPGAAAMRLALLFGEPYLSDDVWRYIWDGRVQAAGINPYRYLPVAPELAFLRDAEVFPNINRARDAPTIYPPGAQVFFYLVTRLGESLTVMKLALVGFEAVGILCLVAILRILGRPPAAVVAYGWHPLPIWEIAGSGHVDAVMVGLLMLGLWAYLRGRTLSAGLAVTIGALCKPVALLALPAFWRPWNWRLVLVFAATVALFYLPYLSVGWRVLGFLPEYLRQEGILDGSGLWLVAALQRVAGPIANGAQIYLAGSALLLFGLAIRIGFRRDRSPQTTLASLHWLLLTYLVLLSPIYPWYFVVLTPLLALTRLTAPWVLATGSFVLYDVIPDDATAVPLAACQAMLYGGTLAAMAFDAWSGRTRGTDAKRDSREART